MSKLETLLLDKNKKMEHELTQLKVKISEKTSLLETADAKVAELRQKVDEQQKLIQKLEDDILQVPPPSAMASTAQELVTTIINVVFKCIYRYSIDLREMKMEDPPSHHMSLSNIDNQIQLLNDLFHQICSSLSSSCVEGFSFNCHPVTLEPTTAVSFIIEGGGTSVNVNVNPRRGVIEPEPSGKPSYLSVAGKASASKLKEASFVDTPIRISFSTSTPHELATTIINDLVFKCILRSMDDLEMSLPRNKSLDKIIVDQICLLVKVMGLICKALPMFVEGVYNIGPKDIVGECTKVEFIEGCYVKEIKKPELRPKPSYLSVAKGISEQQGPWRHSYDGY